MLVLHFTYNFKKRYKAMKKERQSQKHSQNAEGNLAVLPGDTWHVTGPDRILNLWLLLIISPQHLNLASTLTAIQDDLWWVKTACTFFELLTLLHGSGRSLWAELPATRGRVTTDCMQRGAKSLWRHPTCPGAKRLVVLMPIENDQKQSSYNKKNIWYII